MRNPFYKNSRFKSSDHWIPAPADHQVAHLFFSGLNWMGSSEAEIPGELLSYNKGCKPLSITAAPSRAAQAVRSDLGRTRGRPRRAGSARTPTEPRLGTARAHPSARPAPCLQTRRRERGLRASPGSPRGHEGTQSTSSLLAHTRTHPLPAAPADPRGASSPAAQLRGSSRHQGGSDQTLPTWGAGRGEPGRSTGPLAAGAVGDEAKDKGSEYQCCFI